jgi:hypothetical protein
VAALPPTLVHVTPVTAPPNRSVLALEVTSATWLPGSSLTATVTRTAAGTSGTPSAWRLEQGERTISRGTLDTVTTRAGSTGAQDTVQLQWTPSTLAMADTGWISLRLVLDPDAFGTDNARVAVVRRAPPLSVNAREGAGFFVRTALETMADEGRLTLSTMESARIMVLDASELETLGATVNDNRALLLVAPRDPLRATVANRALARRRIPWRFGSVLRDTTALVVTRPLADSMTSGAERSARHLEGMTVTQRYQLTSTTDGAPSRVHAGAGGVPWMVSGVIPSATGDARYVLVGSALTPEATRLPISAAFVPWMTGLMFDALGNERAADSLTAGNVPSAESDFTHLGATTAWRAVTRSATGGAVTLVDDARILVRDTFRQPGKRSLVWPLLLAALLLLVTEGFLVRQLTDRRI